jgi:hypothetical protein
MATPISGGTAFDFGAAAQAQVVQPQTETATTAPARQPAKLESAGDTVKLSAGAQVRLLNSQGDTIPEIVINTALSTQAVNSYLGLAQASAPQAAASSK